MDSSISIAISLASMATSIVSIVVAIASVWYARRQAIAAEGPSIPDIEIQHHGWSRTRGWYRLNIKVVNRTDIAWEFTEARLSKPRWGKILSKSAISSVDRSGNYIEVPLEEIDVSKLSRRTNLGIEVARIGSKSNMPLRGVNDVDYEGLILYLPSSARRFSIRFTLSSKASIVRDRYIDVTRTIADKDIATSP